MVSKDSVDNSAVKPCLANKGFKLLTVSIAAYNVEDYICEALESCLIPSIDLLDIIVVDDGSTDATLSKAEIYGRMYPESIRIIAKENGGYGSTLNTSLDNARGKYFRYLDGDDWFDVDRLQEFVDRLAETDDDVVFTPYIKRYQDRNNGELVDQLAEVSEGSYPFNLIPIKQGMTCPITYKTEVLKRANARFTENCFYVDNEYALLPMRLVRTATVTHIPIYQYRIGREGQSVSVKSILSHIEDQREVSYRLLSDFFHDGVIEGDYPAKQFVLTKLYGITMSVYRNYLLAEPDKRNKDELRSYDLRLQQYSELYECIIKRSRVVKLLHSTNFAAYRILHQYMAIKYRNGVVV